MERFLLRIILFFLVNVCCIVLISCASLQPQETAVSEKQVVENTTPAEKEAIGKETALVQEEVVEATDTIDSITIWCKLSFPLNKHDINLKVDPGGVQYQLNTMRSIRTIPWSWIEKWYIHTIGTGFSVHFQEPGKTKRQIFPFVQLSHTELKTVVKLLRRSIPEKETEQYR